MEFLYSTRWKSIPEIRCFGASGHWHGDGRRGAKSAECQPVFFSGNSEQVNTGMALILLLASNSCYTCISPFVKVTPEIRAGVMLQR
jgi:hypothetical protein